MRGRKAWGKFALFKVVRHSVLHNKLSMYIWSMFIAVHGTLITRVVRSAPEQKRVPGITRTSKAQFVYSSYHATSRQFLYLENPMETVMTVLIKT